MTDDRFMQFFDKIINKLEVKIAELNAERVAADGFRLPKAKITLLGQFSLLANPKIAAKLDIPATIDVDAKIEGDFAIKKAFIEILKTANLEYDEDRSLISIPPNSSFDVLYDSHTLVVTAISPLECRLRSGFSAKNW